MRWGVVGAVGVLVVTGGGAEGAEGEAAGVFDPHAMRSRAPSGARKRLVSLILIYSCYGVETLEMAQRPLGAFEPGSWTVCSS